MPSHDTHKNEEALRTCPWPVGFLERMSRANPDDPQAWSALAEGYLEIGWFNESVDAYLEAVRLSPSAYTWVRLGHVYEAAGCLEYARTCYLNAVNLDPTYVDGWNQLYEIGLLLQDYPASLAAIQEAVILRPEDDGLWNSLGSALTCVRHYGQSIEAHRQALKLNPTNPTAWVGLGAALRATNQLESSARAFENAIRNYDEDVFRVVAWIGLEKTLEMAGRKPLWVM